MAVAIWSDAAVGRRAGPPESRRRADRQRHGGHLTAALVTGLFGLSALAGCVYTIAACAALRAYGRRPTTTAASYPAITVLKPLHGAELDLFNNLLGFCRQDYPAPFEVVFGVSDPDDPAAGVARAVMAACPDRTTTLVTDERRHGQNGKISNLMNMESSIRHAVVVLADSDMVVGPTYLRQVADALAQPGVGLVTCLYRGIATPGFWPRLAAQAIDFHFLPSVIVGLLLGLARPCFGSTIGLRRDTLARIGGFAAFRDVLADDNAMGQAVRDLGLGVAVPARPVLGHVCAPSGFTALFRQDLRWSRTIRAVDPAGFAGSIVTNPLPFAIISCLTGHFSLAPGTILIATLACRLALQLEIGHFVGAKVRGLWLGPLRDMVSFAVFLASFWPGALEWRGHRFVVETDGTMVSPDRTGP